MERAKQSNSSQTQVKLDWSSTSDRLSPVSHPILDDPRPSAVCLPSVHSHTALSRHCPSRPTLLSTRSSSSRTQSVVSYPVQIVIASERAGLSPERVQHSDGVILFASHPFHLACCGP
jgi:hypothetical protein